MHAGATNKSLERQIWALEAYANAARVLSVAKSVDGLAEGVSRGLTSQFPYVVAWVGIAQHDDDKSVKVIGVSGKAKAYAEGIIVSWNENDPSGKGPVGRAIRSGKTQLVNDALNDPAFAPWRDRAAPYGIASYVAVPIVQQGNTVGALIVYASMVDAFSSTEVKLFENLGVEIGFGFASLENQAHLEEERRQKESAQESAINSLELIISAMATTMEMRDPYTSGHQQKVALISEAIAHEIGWDKHDVQGLKLAALIHDIGKVSIPSEILTKPSRLTDIEYALMKEHANNGYLILKDIPFTWPIADTVRQHHERLDGSGYPFGLKGGEILPGARILAVADIIDSMASHRPYRAAQGLERAMEEISKQAGVKLDIDAVNAAHRLYNRGDLSHIVSQPNH